MNHPTASPLAVLPRPSTPGPSHASHGLTVRAAWIGLPLLCACYVTTPVATAPGPVVGTTLHVQLTDDGSLKLAKYLGPRIQFVNGRLLALDDTSLALAVSDVTSSDGLPHDWQGENVFLPRSDIATVEQKKVSWWRSGLLAGGLAALIGSVGIVVGGSSSGRGSGPPTSPK